MEILLIGSGVAGAVGYWWYKRQSQVKRVCVEMGEWVVLDTGSERHIEVLEAFWKDLDITSYMKEFCQCTNRVEFTSCNLMLILITNDQVWPEGGPPTLRIKYR